MTPPLISPATTSDPLVCGIGETGLDYYHPAPDGWNEETFRRRQRDSLEQHFQLAAAANLNLVIHTRDRSGFASFEDALAIYRNHHQRVRALFHCFIGPWGKRRTRNPTRRTRLVRWCRHIQKRRGARYRRPLSRRIVETDSPYLAPEPHRGQRNEPSYVKHVADRLAILRGESIDTLCEHTGKTLHVFFRIPAGESQTIPATGSIVPERGSTSALPMQPSF